MSLKSLATSSMHSHSWRFAALRPPIIPGGEAQLVCTTIVRVSDTRRRASGLAEQLGKSLRRPTLLC
jgi:hypothetical protein